MLASNAMVPESAVASGALIGAMHSNAMLIGFRANEGPLYIVDDLFIGERQG